MKYMLLIYTAPGGDPEPQCTFEDWQQYDKEMKDAGIWVSGDALADLTTTTTRSGLAVRRKDRHRRTLAETREILGGYDVIDVPDLDAQRFHGPRGAPARATAAASRCVHWPGSGTDSPWTSRPRTPSSQCSGRNADDSWPRSSAASVIWIWPRKSPPKPSRPRWCTGPWTECRLNPAPGC